ncbi:MAG: 16S rRNA (adenine(1518)-N(6)/adenine(1519)-N(6))-dimethyltransferase RsmA [Actinobacteria bacterium]|nr:16S rRNA (adenine(1518)-N(6)/adenine(1519)-N(6))-dimethyltransferase RsmA [Actinomycetota bacterium]MBU1610067.1 16S rRNA (adenine(1518)-N(6)/adenine(1519)-N(6))-dimethyltransferase RsmA [Actinomycetota bacterium]MBU2315565.1 16S rRNA (adenine(1518)-N(6)/adenine(1519)-N(6))-dimethyltransferase RsmA [Actinomycetota bacterium]MBU2385365.1 16S rRNA (adenine(1518)-N(6)/adenine(1519)-N(6))-dimethyltransferase RsmA [Actinomycetota bacterium]
MSALLGPAEVRELAEQLGVQPTKRLGQNFVHDANTVRRIVAAAGLPAGATVLEVGPGLGSLTLGLLEAGHPVIAVEIDARLAAQLPRTVEKLQPDAPLTVVTADALRIDAQALHAAESAHQPAPPTALVANLPYNISVPVLLHLLATVPSLERTLVMVQAEVGHRIAAPPGSKVYGSPSVKARWYGPWRVEGTISRQVFWPVPNVDSVLVGMTRTAPPGSEADRLRLGQIVDAAFGQRRKMLRQALAELYGSSAAATAALQAAGLDPTARGEQLGFDDFLRLAQAPRQAPAS